MNRFSPLALLIAGALLIGAGCHLTDDQKDRERTAKKSGAKDAPASKTLWERLGGEPAVTAVVDEFVNVSATDPKVNFTRKGEPAEWNATPANVAKLKSQLVAFISENTGGPIKYKGKDMVAAHAGMNIRGDEFDALAAHLVATLTKFGVKEKEQKELLAVIGPTKGQMVGK